QIVVTTEEMRDTAIKTHHIQPEKIRVIPNYVNTKRFPPAGTTSEKPYIVFVGRLEHQKNVENLLEAVAPLTDTQVDIIGSGSLEDALRHAIEHEHLKHVRLRGNVPNHELAGIFQQATIYVQPSRYE